MIETYRKTVGSDVWHFCVNCSTWPVGDYIASASPQQIKGETLCTECVARHQIGDCTGYSETTVIQSKKCPVIVAGKECGLDLFLDLGAGYHVCSLGHRVLIVPPADSKKSN
jgi:hypothetical protein